MKPRISRRRLLTTVTLIGVMGCLSSVSADTIRDVFLYFRLYINDSTPAPASDPWHSAQTYIRTDSILRITARVLDMGGIEYLKITDSMYCSRFAWRMEEAEDWKVQQPCASLLDSTGCTARLTGNGGNSYQTVRIIVEFHDSALSLHFRDTLVVALYPPPRPPHLVVEWAQDFPRELYREYPVDTVFFASLEAAKSLVSDLRDTFGNLISVCSTATWRPLDTSAVSVMPFYPVNGLVLVKPLLPNARTAIIVRYGFAQKPYDKWPDSISDTVYVSTSVPTAVISRGRELPPPRFDISRQPDRTIRVEMSAAAHARKLAVFDPAGRIVFSTQGVPGKTPAAIVIPALATGIHVIAVRSGAGTYTRALYIP
jgi:hypothetical protein